MGGCEVSGELPPEGWLDDDPTAYIEDVAYRRGILERDLVSTDNIYAQRRLEQYGIDGEGWDVLPEWDPPSRWLTDADRERLAAGLPLEFDPAEATSLTPDELPTDPIAWAELGQRVMAEYPLRADTMYEELVALPDGLERAGFLRTPERWVGLRVFETADGSVRLGPTCGQCHCSFDPYDSLLPIVANKDMDVGAARLLVQGLEPGELPPELEDTSYADLDRLGPGRADVQADGRFNPFAIPDLGGLIDLPFLQQNANWHHRGNATLAVRCETLFMTASREQTRIPRALSWALAEFVRAQPPPPPLDPDPAPEAEAGEQVFADAGCDGCHTPPLYTSDRRVTVEEVGTDDSAGLSPIRRTGYYRIPSLRGVGRTGPYLHHGAIGSLEEFFDPERTERGHPWGLDLDVADRQALVAFLRSI
ncbi:MAG: hypothetical protein GY898_28060 [Proteobacteria bacterium]|nr:hypothetical protein [Pseudomonadota bacterium]